MYNIKFSNALSVPPLIKTKIFFTTVQSIAIKEKFLLQVTINSLRIFIMYISKSTISFFAEKEKFRIARSINRLTTKLLI